MSETTQAERLYLDLMTADFDETDAAPISTRLLRKLLDDADRLAAIEWQLDRAHDSLHELLANHINIMDPAATIAKRGLWGETQPEQEDT